MNEWKELDKEIGLSTRLESILKKSATVFKELQKRELLKGEHMKDLVVQSAMEKSKKRKVGK